jgi:hypothetical protein
MGLAGATYCITSREQGADVAKFYSTLVESQSQKDAEFVASNKVKYTFSRQKNAMGEYVNLVESHPDGRTHRICIAEEAHEPILEFINQLSVKHFGAGAKA